MCIDILISRAVNQSILISRAVSQPALTHPYTCVWIHVLACIVQELECIFDVLGLGRHAVFLLVSRPYLSSP